MEKIANVAVFIVMHPSRKQFNEALKANRNIENKICLHSYNLIGKDDNSIGYFIGL